MNHELRTPLTSIIGFSELLKDKAIVGELNEKQEHLVDKVLSNSDHLLELINDFLDLSKIEAGKTELVIEEFSVPAAIDEAVTLIKEIAAKRNITFRNELEPLDIKADKRRFKQIILNLLNNAVKFSKPGGGIVTIAAKKSGDMAQISVSDTGIGIKKEDLERLFWAFEQLDSGNSRKYGGTGLGLTISKRLVELHGGTIRVESKYGEGSTFSILLPINYPAL
jgi:signal transduction histidine kinase